MSYNRADHYSASAGNLTRNKSNRFEELYAVDKTFAVVYPGP